MSSLASNAALIVSTMDLKLVQDVIGAMRAADAAAGAQAQNPLTPLPTIESPRHIHPDPIYENPRVIRPEPRSQPLPALHLKTSVENHPRLALQPAPAEKTEHVHNKRWDITPPWAVLPWQQPAPAPTPIKIVQYRTDILSKGSLIDMFI